MGDTCCLPFSMGKVKKTIEEEIDGIYVYSIELGGEEALDWIMGFFANMDDQVQHICDKLAGGFNAIGFSQGGQFLRAYVERCNSPPVKNLITFGGQHMGVDDFPECVDTNDTICRLAAEAFGLGAYLPEIRHDLVQAQYCRDVMDYTGYLKYNEFLADINNELPTKNATYKANLMSLENLVLIKFEKDTVVVARLGVVRLLRNWLPLHHSAHGGPNDLQGRLDWAAGAQQGRQHFPHWVPGQPHGLYHGVPHRQRHQPIPQVNPRTTPLSIPSVNWQ